MFYIPFVCAFWINFGGDVNAEKMKQAGQDSEGWRTFNNLMYSVWEITVVGNYPWDSLLVIDRIMAQILCGTYLAVSAIVCLNLFIALMSDTFQRVYDNANANAVMQKASTILLLETEMSGRRRDMFMNHIHTSCAPEVMNTLLLLVQGFCRIVLSSVNFLLLDLTIDILYTLDSASNYSAIQKLKP
jgi:hypothetical protein